MQEPDRMPILGDRPRTHGGQEVLTRLDACDLSELLQCYTEDWVSLCDVEIFQSRSVGTFLLGAPPYANPKMAANFEYLTAPTFLVNCFQLSMAHFYAHGLSGGIGELRYDASKVVRSIKAGGARVARVKDLQFKSEITKDAFGPKYVIEQELYHYRLHANQLFFESSFSIGHNHAKCRFIGVVAHC